MIIIRKPKSMRSDLAMKNYLNIAGSYSYLALITDDLDKKYEYAYKCGEFINTAAKIGGFFTVKSMIKWLNIHGEEA